MQESSNVFLELIFVILFGSLGGVRETELLAVGRTRGGVYLAKTPIFRTLLQYQ